MVTGGAASAPLLFCLFKCRVSKIQQLSFVDISVVFC